MFIKITSARNTKGSGFTSILKLITLYMHLLVNYHIIHLFTIVYVYNCFSFLRYFIFKTHFHFHLSLISPRTLLLARYHT